MYIGNKPTIGNFVKLDAITATATTTFNLLNGGVAYYPQSANHCLVSLNGILQAPTDSFTISGSTIIFSSALTTSDVIDFIIVLGDVLNIGTPSDSTVSLAKLTATGTKNSTTFLRGDNTFAVPAGGVNTPAFEATISSTQAVTLNGVTKVQLNTESFDIGSCFDSSTNYRFTPNVAGKYFIYGQIYFYNTAGANTVQRGDARIYKNGSVHKSQMSGVSDYPDSTFNEAAVTVNAIIDFNGSTDYIELFVYAAGSSGTPTLSNGSGENFVRLGGFRIIE